MLEPEQLLDDGQLSGGGGFGPLSVERLVKSSGWINFISIFFYILGTVMGLLMLYGVIMDGSNMDGEILLVFLLMIGFIAAIFTIGRQLQKLATATRQLGYGGANPRKTAEICTALRRVFTTFGVMVIVAVVFGIIGYLIIANQYPYYY